MRISLITSIKKGGKFKLSPNALLTYTLVDYIQEDGVMKCICDNYDYTETFTDESTGEEITCPAWPDSVRISYFSPDRLVYPL